MPAPLYGRAVSFHCGARGVLTNVFQNVPCVQKGEDRAAVSGTLQRDISVTESSWHEKKMETYLKVTIKLVKALPMLSWDFPIRSAHPATGEMDGQSELEVAKYYGKNGDRERCLHHASAAVAAGHPGSLLCLGKLYSEAAGGGGRSASSRDSSRRRMQGSNSGSSSGGGGGGKGGSGLDLIKALEHFVLAAEQHKVGEAMYRVGLAKMKGRGCARNHLEAVHWFEMCADAEQIKRDMVLDRARQHPPFHALDAMFNLGVIHHGGEAGVVKNLQLAVEWWEKAARHKSASAMFNLGMAYRHGLGVQASSSIAMDYFKRAHSINPKLMVPLTLGDGNAAGNGAGPAVDGAGGAGRRSSHATPAGGGTGGVDSSSDMLFSPLAPSRMGSLVDPDKTARGFDQSNNDDDNGGLPPFYGAKGKVEDLIGSLEEQTGLSQQTLMCIGVGAAALGFVLLLRKL